MHVIGIILILLVVALYVGWIYFTKKQTGTAAKLEKGVQEFDIIVKGVYSPSVLHATAGSPVRINFLRQEDTDCSRFVVFDDLHIRKDLPRDQKVTVEFTPRKGVYAFTCDMGMYQGKLIAD